MIAKNVNPVAVNNERGPRTVSKTVPTVPSLLRLCAVAFLSFRAVSTFGTPESEALAMIVNPPRVARLVAKRSFEDGSEAFFLVKYDGGNAFVKMSKTRSALDRRVLIKGDVVSGRVSEQIWVGDDALGSDLWAADIHVPVTTDPAVLQHQKIALLLADQHSRLGRSLLTFGIDVPVAAQLLITNGAVIYDDGGFRVTAGVVIQPQAAGGAAPFTSKWRKVAIAERSAGFGKSPKAPDEMYECRGELSPKTMLPLWFELLQTDAQGRTINLGRAVVLEVEFASKPLTPDAFSILDNVGGGVRSLLLQTNSTFLHQDLFTGVAAERRVYFFGLSMGVNAIRYSVLLAIAAVSIVFAAVIVFNRRRRQTNN